MSLSINAIIANAILGHLATTIGSGPTARAFVRLEGFSEETYQHLLDTLVAQQGQLAGRTLIARSITAITGHPEVAMENDRSATWYRNNLPANQTLLIILNRRTSDAQSLQDIYAIGEQTLTYDNGLERLIDASFVDYQLDKHKQYTIASFVKTLRRLRMEPQLRDLTEFLRAIDKQMDQRRTMSLAEAIGETLPALNLFRCRQLADHINTSRGDKLLRTLKDAAQIGSEVLEERVRQEYLARLEKASLADDTEFHGLSSSAKAELLRRFIDGTLGDDRAEMQKVLQIDWKEVEKVISIRGRGNKTERYQKVAERLQALTQQHQMTASDDFAEVVESLSEGQEPDGEALERLLSEDGASLGKALRNDLRRMLRPRTRRNADFLVGLATIAIDLLQARQNELSPDARLQVTVHTDVLHELAKHYEAATVFLAIYGGIEQTIPAVQWQLEKLWEVARGDDPDPETPSNEEERLTRDALPFRVALLNGDGNELAVAELIWQYRSDSPAAATAQALATEHALLESSDFGPLFAQEPATLRVPIYNHAQRLEEIGDLDLSHPLNSLGPWYEQASDLRAMLEQQLKPVARGPVWAAFEVTLTALERAWAAFVTDANQGLLNAEVGPLLNAYEALFDTALNTFTTGNEIGASYRLINQAWLIGPQNFDSWAIMPLLHPLKLLWWRERARFINSLIARLLDHATPASIVDVKRFQQELAATYGSSSFPPVLALPPGGGRTAARFLPIEESEGYELYFHEEANAEAFGLDPDLLAEDENALAAQRAVEGIVAVVQDYIETYPFVRDGIEILLFECRNGALPGLLVEHLSKASERRNWKIRLTIVVHTSSRGAPLFRRVSKWVAGNSFAGERQGQSYFPMVSLKVLECPPEALFHQHDDTDIVVLADVLAEKGQRIEAEVEPVETADLPTEGYLPTYRARQEPFMEGETERRIALNTSQQPAVVRLFLLAQYTAISKRQPRKNHEARFYRHLSLDEWHSVIEQLHKRFNWIICYDTSIDRFLLEATFPQHVQVIRYSLGLGAKRQHNLTVSSSGRAQEIVIQRLATRLSSMIPQAPDHFCKAVALQLVNQAKEVSGDIVLRAAGPGAFLNELIGLVVARFETERRYRAQHPEALCTWILLDDFEHWFGSGKFPDLLFVAIDRTTNDELALHLEVLEAKCVGELSFASEARDAQLQVLSGIDRFTPAFAPGAAHLDALYWYDQLYRAVTGNLKVQPEQQDLWELFRDQLQIGAFQLSLSGHTWIFCYDGQAEVLNGPHEEPFGGVISEETELPLRAHHYGRNELAHLLGALTSASGGPAAPAEWLKPVVAPRPEKAAEMVLPLPPAEGTGVREALPPIKEPEVRETLSPLPEGKEPEVREALPPSTGPALREPAPEQQWLTDKARDLSRALQQRGIQFLPIDSAQADVGPSIVRFKLRLRPGESLRKLQNIAEDLARDLALARTPIIDNVLRTNFVGIDIPREQPQMIDLHPLLNNLGTPGIAELPIIIGISPDGALLVDDLSTFPHLLVAGATGSGKSVFLRSLLLSLMTQYPAGKLELLIVDPKQTDFSFFDGLPYLRGGKVFTQPAEAQTILLELVRNEMPRRQQLMKGRSLNIKEFNRRFPDEAMPPIVALIDEYAQLMSILNKKDAESFERDLMSLAAVSRSAGIHLVLATQRPSADVVTSTLKANLDARIAFRVASNTNSRVVLDATGAENLLGKGDMLFRRPSGEIVRLQAPFMGEEQMQAYLGKLAGQ